MYSEYRTSRCYRVSLLNAGHLGQTSVLTATALGLGPARTGAFRDTLVADRFGLAKATPPLYLPAAGWPHPEPRRVPPVAGLETFRRNRLPAEPPLTGR